ncbi:MAG TPA: trypsin-like peptidase domain-containing protein [Aliidongia sp.]|uniref:trypsin-like peptidase domain-containing protein n=1 Tax=Aliidongia sp. TaxID=1914230 RepID=UPI002DDD8BC8|nr:trypsin-like peptidase domain-containing protein [Aliidongia sp.]HEV2674579.1 trypsin-like peptidase domain-containing protein [Aliidongia sp.]
MTRSLCRFLTGFLFGLALISGMPAQAAFPSSPDGPAPTVAPVLRQVTPGVVNIAVQGRVRVNNPLLADPFFRQFFNLPNGQVERRTQASGSGVIVDADKGYVLTNNHVVENADVIDVTLRDRRTVRAKLIGRDPQTDIAVLQIQADNLVAVPMGDSDKSEVGDFVLAIGNPFGLGQTVTSGIVSALGRSGLGIEGFEDFIQTDAAINPGNSGGALVDLKGRLIGINTAILAPAGGNVGVGFAVPINMAKSIMEQLLRYGTVEHGRVGISGQDMTAEIARGLGTSRTEGGVVTAIEPGSSADRAGLKVGDVVVAVDHQPSRNWISVVNRIALARVDQDVTLTVDRHGALSDLHVTVAATPAKPRQARGGQGYQ